MSKTPSIFDHAKYIYAEMIGDKPVTLTITKCETTEITGDQGRKSIGFAISFKETPKQFVFSSMAVIRALAGALGTDYSTYAGNKVELYTVPSTRSPSGFAVRVRAPQRKAQAAASRALDAITTTDDEVPR